MEYLQTSENYLPELDENNQKKINPDYYKQTIKDLIIRYIEDSHNDPTRPTLNMDKLTNNNMLSILNYIHSIVFHNNNKQYTTQNACNIPYTKYNIETLLKVYKDIVLSFNCTPSLYQFSMLTGIQEDTIKKYLTAASMEIVNIRREILRNELSNDRMGRIVLANNDNSYGLEYEKKQAVDRETIRQGMTLDDLKMIE